MSVLKARRRATEVFCIRYTGDNEDEVIEFTNDLAYVKDERLYLPGSFDTYPVHAGDYIVENGIKRFSLYTPTDYARTFEEPEEYSPVSIFYEFDMLKQKQLVNFTKRMEERRQAKMKANNEMITLGEHMVVSIFEKVANNECSITGLSKQNEGEDGNCRLWIELTFFRDKNKDENEGKDGEAEKEEDNE